MFYVVAVLLIACTNSDSLNCTFGRSSRATCATRSSARYIRKSINTIPANTIYDSETCTSTYSSSESMSTGSCGCRWC